MRKIGSLRVIRRARATTVRLGVLVLGVGLVAAACSGSGGDSSGSQSSAGTTDNTTSGVLRIAADLSGTAAGPVGFDPAQQTTGAGQLSWQLPIYDSLLNYTSDGKLVPGLAAGAKVVNPTTVSVQLRPNLVFSDGTTLDADAVRASILRNKNAKQRGQFSPTLQAITAIKVTSPTALTITLNQAKAGEMYTLLAGPETFVASPKAKDLNEHPIGAGPFMLKGQSAQKIVMVKNPKYWKAKSIKLAEIDFVNVSGGPQSVNAVRAQQVDYANVQVTDVKALRSDSSVHVTTKQPAHSMLYMPLCKTYKPLGNPSVRKALSLAIDRAAINNGILQGLGEPAKAMYPQSSPLFASQLSSNAGYDPKQAQKLLKQAGYADGFDLTLTLLPGTPVTRQVAEVVQADWKKIGVTLKLENSTDFVTDLYIKHKGQTSVLPTRAPGLGMLRQVLPGTIGDLCNYSNPQINKAAGELYGLLPDSPDAAALWKQLQVLIADDTAELWLDFVPVAVATTSNVEDINLITSYIVPVPDFHTIYVTG